MEIAEEGRARATLTLAQPALVQQAYVLDPIADQPARLVVDLILTTPEEFAGKVATTTTPLRIAEPPPESPTTRRARTAGEPDGTRPLVVIDPGPWRHRQRRHRRRTGSTRRTSCSPSRSSCRKCWSTSGRFDVALTREDDTFLRLEERVALARAEQGRPLHLAPRRHLPAAGYPRRQRLYARRERDRRARQGAGRQREQVRHRRRLRDARCAAAGGRHPAST